METCDLYVHDGRYDHGEHDHLEFFRVRDHDHGLPFEEREEVRKVHVSRRPTKKRRMR